MTTTDQLVCPLCFGPGHEEGCCGSCGRLFVTCDGFDYDDLDCEAPTHDEVAFAPGGAYSLGDRCPRSDCDAWPREQVAQ